MAGTLLITEPWRPSPPRIPQVVLEHPTGRRGAMVDVLMILAFVIVIVIVVCLWLINRALKSKED
jgi:hypothetical protein